MSNRVLMRGALLVAAAGTLAACSDDTAKVLGPRPTAANGLFASYVSLGNSITAGYQSSGINDSTQARSYAVLLAAQMGTRFAYPSLLKPGCPPPVANFLTQARVPLGTTPTTGTTCVLRNPASSTSILNNVAVPGATSLDPTAVNGTTSSSVLTTLILGGKTQVQKALDAQPTFATMWIGNNDVLGPAIAGVLTPLPGVSTGITDTNTFKTNFTADLTGLTAAPTLKGGVLIGVVNVANIPILFPVGQLIASATFRGAFDQAAGYNPASSDPFKKTPITIDASCTTSQTTLVSFAIAPQIAAFRNDSTKAPASRAGHPPVIACGTVPTGFAYPVGDIFILTPAEQATLTTVITAYNNFISSRATALGWTYLNPNTPLDSLKSAGQIPPGPNFTATTPYGKWISLDGVHPSSAAHQLITNYLINVINAKYGTTLVKLPNP